MGSEAVDEELSLTLKLPLFSIPANMHSPERPGMLTPPLHTSAAVPFRWEEEPGKPKPCTALATIPDSENDLSQKCLELPPRLLLMDANMTKLSSPTTVLDGPYVGRSSRFQGPSFRMSSECYGSFRKSLSPERDHDEFGALVLSKRVHNNDKGLFGSWRKKSLKSKKEVGGGSYVFPSSVDRESECSREGEGSSGSSITRIRRSGSFTTVSRARPRFWATLCGGLKQVVVPWRNRKAKKDGLHS
ncbi:DUF688 domain-containing protein [Melia azedarach]|uniref:DUF688 domain-containing protein n=1 Tax=Melia azedarach TaxID=155640 RepID=A0ACC1YX64_MELAZ|nr:DUF688 domain-containing protein [Melia azedarach]